MKISFCTTCMGRLHHLRETLPANLKANETYEAAEFVVLDYNSGDGLEDWMQTEMRWAIEAGRVAYYRERTARFFNPRHAKNVAHLLATGDILINLDADNFTGNGYAQRLAEIFLEPNVFVRADIRRPSMRGIAGRLALRATDFRLLRGYDETCNGYGGDDPELCYRARVQLHLQETALAWPGEAVIQHSNVERIERFESQDDVHVSNKRYAELRRSRDPLAKANPAGYGAAVIYAGFAATPTQVGMGPV